MAEVKKADAAVALAYKNAASSSKPTAAQLKAIKVANAASVAANTVVNNLELDVYYPVSAAAIRSPLGKADLAASKAFSNSVAADFTSAFAAEGRQVRGKLTTNSRGAASGYAYIGSQDNANKGAQLVDVTLAQIKAPAGYAVVKPFTIRWNLRTSKWDLVDAAHHPGIRIVTNKVVWNGAHQLDFTDVGINVTEQPSS